ncbi:hypothetical protein CDAR_200051 [Caerostris darwini]|uniref:Uncharacterized protein n=1 Tax=Caerostris darwini TaxID=1538125 RepID=A0AAV4PLU0_9ARAC|nr:hypothetical protein CDAR_200051 [Caerostris darwini]
MNQFSERDAMMPMRDWTVRVRIKHLNFLIIKFFTLNSFHSRTIVCNPSHGPNSMLPRFPQIKAYRLLRSQDALHHPLVMKHVASLSPCWDGQDCSVIDGWIRQT